MRRFLYDHIKIILFGSISIITELIHSAMHSSCAGAGCAKGERRISERSLWICYCLTGLEMFRELFRQEGIYLPAVMFLPNKGKEELK